VHPESGLTSARLSHRDIPEESWNLCRVHALAVTDYEGPPDDLTPEEFLEQDDIDDTAPSALQLLLDIDYVVRKVEQGRWDIKFWVAPATLVFESVMGIRGDLRAVCLPFELRGLHHDSENWHIEGKDFDLRFSALGYTLILRQAPRFGNRVLRRAERGGINFDFQPFA